MELLEQTPVPWAQGVGRSNRPAPTNLTTHLFAMSGLGPASAPVAVGGVLGFPEASSSYNFNYSP